MLGRERLGERERVVAVGAATRHATAPVSAAPGAPVRERVEECRVAEAATTSVPGAVLGLGEQVEPQRLGIGVAGGDQSRSLGPAKPSMPTCRTPAAWPPARTGSRADDHVDRRRWTRSRTRARRSHGHRPSGRRRGAGEPAGAEHEGIELAVARGGEHTAIRSTPATRAGDAPIRRCSGTGPGRRGRRRRRANRSGAEEHAVDRRARPSAAMRRPMQRHRADVLDRALDGRGGPVGRAAPPPRRARRLRPAAAAAPARRCRACGSSRVRPRHRRRGRPR